MRVSKESRVVCLHIPGTCFEDILDLGRPDRWIKGRGFLEEELGSMLIRRGRIRNGIVASRQEFVFLFDVRMRRGRIERRT